MDGSTNNNCISIAFTGGGTGGHIYPGLAVAVALKQQLSCRIFWIGSGAILDKSIVQEAGIEFFSIPAGKLRRNFSLRNFTDMFRVFFGFIAARKILKREKPIILFSKGGFVSVPPCAAASLLGIPVFTHESDYSPGLATRINAVFAAKGAGRIITAYPETAERLPEKVRNKVSVLGNPVREVFRNADPEKGRAFLDADKNQKILLVLGGSQGALELNELVTECLEQLTKNYLVVHQYGANWTPKDALSYKPYPYIKDEMPHVLAAANLVLARSGAGTVWESAVAGKPMILLPLAGIGTRGDQLENARFFEKAGAAIVLPPEKRTASDLHTVMDSLSDEIVQTMAAASRMIGKTDGTTAIVQLLIETIQQTKTDGITKREEI